MRADSAQRARKTRPPYCKWRWGIGLGESGDIGDAVRDAQQCGFDVVLLVEVGDADHRDVQFFGHVLERREHTAHVGCRASVHFANAKICADQIDDLSWRGRIWWNCAPPDGQIPGSLGTSQKAPRPPILAGTDSRGLPRVPL